MAKIPRKLAKIFGSTAGLNQIAEFGSLAASAPAFSTDPEVIQSLSNWLTGWFGAVVGANSPAIQDMNAFCYVMAYQIAYIMQEGIPEWNSATTYYEGSIVLSGNFLYQSTTNNNTGNSVTDGVNWRVFSSGSASALEILEQRNENQYYGIITDPLDNSVGTGFAIPPASYLIQGILLQAYTASATTMSLVLSPKVLNTADPNTTTTSGWSTTTEAASLTTSATRKVGATSVSFTKTSGGTLSNISYDAGALTLGVNGFSKLFVWVNLSSAAGVSSVQVVIDIDTTNKQTFTATTNSAGGAFVTGFNLIAIDLSTGGSAGGTGWTPALAFRYFRIGINTAVAGTVPVVLINGIFFGIDNPQQYFTPGTQLDIFDGTNSEDVTIDVSNSTPQGLTVTIAAALANSYAGGYSNTSLYRSSLTIGSGQAILGTLDPNGNTLAGAITLRQSARISKILRETLAGATISSSISIEALQVYPATTVGGGSIIVSDPADDSANLLSGDVVHVFQTIYDDGLANYVYRGDMTLSGNSTPSGGFTTLPGTPPGGTVVGDTIVKKNLSAAKVSFAATSANENFVNMTPVLSPNGIILMDNGLPIPNYGNVTALYTLSGTRGTVNRAGAAPGLILNGSLTTNAPFKNGQFGTTGWSSANYYSLVNGTDLMFDNQSVLAVSFWIFPTSSAADHRILGRANVGGGSGWYVNYYNGAANISLYVGGTLVTSSNVLTLGAYHHVVAQFRSTISGGMQIYIDNVLAGSGTGTINSSGGAAFTIGYDVIAGSSALAGADILSQIDIQTGKVFTPAQIATLYNNGKAAILGFNGNLKYRFENTGMTGQRLSTRVAVNTDTTAIRPFVTQTSAIKTA